MLARLKTVTSAMLLAGGLVFTQAALGLGLGEITLNSTLDEPLDATVELLDVGGLDESQVIVALGSEEEFARVDLERTQFLASIAFAVEVNGNTGTIHLTTTTNVAEPYLDFVISARSPDGDVSREYTLLIDLPDFTAAAVEVPAPAATVAPPAAEPARAAAPAATLDPVTGDGTFTVNPGDTMFEIAAATRPDTSVSVQQMMVAIQRANPDAFVANDINRVRTGRVLRIPALQEITVIDQATAVAQIGQQNLGGQPLAVNTGNAAGNTAPQGDELSVLTTDDAIASGTGNSDLAATLAALESELMLSEESLDRARLENLELNNRISSLQDEIDLLQNIIAIEDERIAQLQAELASQSQATAQALAQAQAAQTELAALEDQQPSGLMGQLNGLLQNGLVALLAAIALVLAVLGFLVLKRRRDEAAAEENAFNPTFAGIGGAAPPPPGLVSYAAEAPVKTGPMAGVLARFRRPKDADPELDDDVIDRGKTPAGATPEPVVVVAPVVAVPVAECRGDTDELLEDMGITDEMLSLDEALSDIDETVATEDEAAAAVNNMAAFDASGEDAELLAALELEETRDDSPPDAGAFSAPPAAAAADAEEEVESFEFTLRDTPDSAGSKSIDLGSDADGDLGSLNFDDTMLSDEDEDESPYKSRSGMDECDTKLDLATAYEAMGDVSEAIEILDEVIADGNPGQVEMARRLKQSWQST